MLTSRSAKLSKLNQSEGTPVIGIPELCFKNNAYRFSFLRPLSRFFDCPHWLRARNRPVVLSVLTNRYSFFFCKRKPWSLLMIIVNAKVQCPFHYGYCRDGIRMIWCSDIFKCPPVQLQICWSVLGETKTSRTVILIISSFLYGGTERKTKITCRCHHRNSPNTLFSSSMLSKVHDKERTDFAQITNL